MSQAEQVLEIEIVDIGPKSKLGSCYVLYPDDTEGIITLDNIHLSNLWSSQQCHGVCSQRVWTFWSQSEGKDGMVHVVRSPTRWQLGLCLHWTRLILSTCKMSDKQRSWRLVQGIFFHTIFPPKLALTSIMVDTRHPTPPMEWAVKNHSSSKCVTIFSTSGVNIQNHFFH